MDTAAVTMDHCIRFLLNYILEVLKELLVKHFIMKHTPISAGDVIILLKLL